MKTSALCLLFVIFFSCNFLLDDGDYRFYPERREIAVVTRSQYISHTPSEVIYEFDIVLLAYYQESPDFTDIPVTDFDFGTTGSTEVISFNKISVAAPTQSASSTLIMLDESGSYEEIDPYNIRSQAVSKFISDISASGNFMLAGFSSGGKLAGEPVQYFQSDFTSDWNSAQSDLFSLAKLTGGTSKLYDAALSAINKLNENEINQQKHLVLVAHAADNGSSSSAAIVIQKAIASRVRIHTLEFGNELLAGPLTNLSGQTAGIHSFCATAEELVTEFNHLHRLLTGAYEPLRIRLRFKPGATAVQSGFEFTQQIKITSAKYDFEYNPAYVFIKVP